MDPKRLQPKCTPVQPMHTTASGPIEPMHTHPTKHPKPTNPCSIRHDLLHKHVAYKHADTARDSPTQHYTTITRLLLACTTTRYIQQGKVHQLLLVSTLRHICAWHCTLVNRLLLSSKFPTPLSLTRAQKLAPLLFYPPTAPAATDQYVLGSKRAST